MWPPQSHQWAENNGGLHILPALAKDWATGSQEQSMIMLVKNTYHSNCRGEELREAIQQKMAAVTRGAHVSWVTLKVSSTVQLYEGDSQHILTYWLYLCWKMFSLTSHSVNLFFQCLTSLYGNTNEIKQIIFFLYPIDKVKITWTAWWGKALFFLMMTRSKWLKKLTILWNKLTIKNSLWPSNFTSGNLSLKGTWNTNI